MRLNSQHTSWNKWSRKTERSWWLCITAVNFFFFGPPDSSLSMLSKVWHWRRCECSKIGLWLSLLQVTAWFRTKSFKKKNIDSYLTYFLPTSTRPSQLVSCLQNHMFCYVALATTDNRSITRHYSKLHCTKLWKLHHDSLHSYIFWAQNSCTLNFKPHTCLAYEQLASHKMLKSSFLLKFI